jgi:hypothetical protein
MKGRELAKNGACGGEIVIKYDIFCSPLGKKQ